MFVTQHARVLIIKYLTTHDALDAETALNPCCAAMPTLLAL